MRELVNESFRVFFGVSFLPALLRDLDVRPQYFEDFCFCHVHDVGGKAEGALVVQQVLERDAAELVEVVVVQKEVAASQLSIAPSTADLLDVVLNGARHVEVNDRLDVALVNAHREGDRAAEHTHLVGDELLLNEATLLVRFASVVGGCRDALLSQVRSNLLGRGSLRREHQNRVELAEAVSPQQRE